MPSTRGRQVVVPLTNKSGGAVAAGDVVIIDTANDTAFTTTTTGRAEVSIGIAQEAIANNATGRVLTAGYAALVNVPASVTRGHYVETHTVAKQATGSSTRRSGSFGQFLTGGTTPTAVLWGQTDQTSASSSTPAFVGARATASGNTTITSANTEYAIAFAGTDTYDTNAFHDPASNNSRMTIPSGKDGYYFIRGQTYVAAGTSDYVDMKIRKGGAAGTVLSQARVTADDGNTMIQVSCVAYLAATDYVQLYIMCATGSRAADASVSAFEIALLGT